MSSFFVEIFDEKQSQAPKKFQLPSKVTCRLQSEISQEMKDDYRELIDCLKIKQCKLNPIVQVECLALIIQSYLNNQIHLKLENALSIRYMLHSSLHPLNILMLPSKHKTIINHDINKNVNNKSSGILALNNNFELTILKEYNLENMLYSASHCILINNVNNKYPTLILSMPKQNCLISVCPNCVNYRVIQNFSTNYILYLWKQSNDIGYCLTRKNLNSVYSVLKLYKIMILNDGTVQLNIILTDIKVAIPRQIDFRIDNAYYYNSNVNNEDNNEHNDPQKEFLIFFGDANYVYFGLPNDDHNITNSSDFALKPLHQKYRFFFYHSFHKKFLAVDKQNYLISIEINKHYELVETKKYKQLVPNGLQYFVYDYEIDSFIICHSLGISNKYKSELISLPVTDYLMKD